MRKIDRLFEIIQALRGQRLRTAFEISKELGVSIRTIYRDIDALIASGIPIEGARGLGFIIRDAIEMPPLHLSARELESIKFAISMVRAVADNEIIKAANEALLKIEAVSPKASEKNAKQNSHVFYSINDDIKEKLEVFRKAIEAKNKLEIEYIDLNEIYTKRIFRPLGLEFWGNVWTLSGWCELRNGFRVFRIDRVVNFKSLNDFFKIEQSQSYAEFCKTQCLDYCLKNGLMN